jgi:hypothetical protein
VVELRRLVVERPDKRKGVLGAEIVHVDLVGKALGVERGLSESE